MTCIRSEGRCLYPAVLSLSCGSVWSGNGDYEESSVVSVVSEGVLWCCEGAVSVWWRLYVS